MSNKYPILLCRKLSKVKSVWVVVHQAPFLKKNERDSDRFPALVPVSSFALPALLNNYP